MGDDDAAAAPDQTRCRCVSNAFDTLGLTAGVCADSSVCTRGGSPRSGVGACGRVAVRQRVEPVRLLALTAGVEWPPVCVVTCVRFRFVGEMPAPRAGDAGLEGARIDPSTVGGPAHGVFVFLGRKRRLSLSTTGVAAPGIGAAACSGGSNCALASASSTARPSCGSVREQLP